jgi:hypothetical protein
MTKERAINEKLLALEKSLKSRLHPVTPDRQFVGRLRKRLENSPVYQKQQRLAATFLSIAAGLVFGLVIFLIGRGFIKDTKEA